MLFHQLQRPLRLCYYPLVRTDKGIFESEVIKMFIVYVDIDKDGEACKPYTGREYYTRSDADEELKEATEDPAYYHAWVEEV